MGAANGFIDLYSDTVTRPTTAMRKAMADAEVGDEQSGSDPTTRALEIRVAALLGKDAAIFLPSATMGNAIACRLHTQPGDAVILDAGCHIVNHEAGGLAVHVRAIPRIINGDRGRFTPDEVAERITGADPYRPRSTLLACEQTHNLGGGSIWPEHQLRAVATLAREHGLRTHLDGARLMNAVVASGIAAKGFAEPFDTVTLCLSKGLGCPVGALLAGSTADLARARTLKQQFGGAMRQTGILAAAGLHALDHHVERLADDHANARRLAAGLANVVNLMVETPIETNMVFVKLPGPNGPDVATRLRAAGVGVSVSAPDRLRLVTHLDISSSDIDRAIERIRTVFSAGR